MPREEAGPVLSISLPASCACSGHSLDGGEVSKRGTDLPILAGPSSQEPSHGSAWLCSALASFSGRLFLHMASVPTSSSRPRSQGCSGKSFSFQRALTRVLGLGHWAQLWAGKRVLVPCSGWPGMSHMPISGPAGVVSSTQARWAENEGGGSPKETLGGGAGTGLAGTQPGLGPGARLWPVNWSVGLVSGPVGAQATPGLRIPASPVVGRAEAAGAFLPHGSLPKVRAGPEEFLLLVIGQSWSHAPL